MSKTFRKRLKRDQSQSTKKLVMDEDNDIFDIDFWVYNWVSFS